ncbi:MAG: transposase [Synergistaceae bacterium]|nr:transposase [Synergistaceae bacterium]
MLFKLRWPDGFICPKCGHASYYGDVLFGSLTSIRFGKG